MKFTLRQLTLFLVLGIFAMPSLLAVWWWRDFSEKKQQTERQILEALIAADLQEIFVRTSHRRASDNMLFYFPTTSELDSLLRQQAPTRELSLEMQRSLHGTLDWWVKVDPRRADSLFHSALLAAGILLDYRFLQVDLERGDTVFSIRHDVRRWWQPRAMQIQRHVHADTLLHHSDNSMAYVVSRESVVPLLLERSAPTLLLFSVIIGVSAVVLRLWVRQQEAERASAEFTHNIAHELKTPIAVALAAHESLVDFGADINVARRSTLLATSRRQLVKLSELVEQMLVVWRRAGTVALRYEKVEILPLLQRLQDEHELKSDKPVSIFLHVESPKISVEADATHLYHILGNLVDNGVKYSHERAEIDISVGHDAARKQIVFSVADKGRGIKRSDRRRIFKKFFRISEGKLNDVEGCGLGLFYVRMMIERHGGHIEVNSTPGKGSVFTFGLPETPLSP